MKRRLGGNIFVIIATQSIYKLLEVKFLNQISLGYRKRILRNLPDVEFSLLTERKRSEYISIFNNDIPIF